MIFSAIISAALVSATGATEAQVSETAENAVAEFAKKEAFGADASAAEILRICREMLPTDVAISGHVNRRSRRGTEIAAYKYKLTKTKSSTDVTFWNKNGEIVPFEKGGRLLDTDVRWSDLTMDFLFWDDVEFDEKAEAESFQGIICKVIRVRKGDVSFRAWIDRRSGAMIQAQELRGEKTVREIFCTSLKKFGERWAPKNIEVGPIGAKYRTKIVIEDVKVNAEQQIIKEEKS